MARSLLRQLEQIRRAATYDDVVVGLNTSAVAEPVVSGSLQEDTNVIRSLMKQFKGSTNWYDEVPDYFDPTSTTSGDANTKSMNLTNVGGNTLDARTIILAVTEDSSGSGYTVSGTSTGVLLDITTGYADHTDRRGLPIFNSVGNHDSYYDEAGEDRVCRIDVIDMSNDQEFQTPGGYTIYAKFHDAGDHTGEGGTGEGTDVFARFYANNAVATLSGTGVISVGFVYPHRKVLSDTEEYEWLRTDFISSWEGDVELMEDISNLWSYTGSSDGVSDPTWTNTGIYHSLASDPSDLTTAINSINDDIGDRTFTEENYLTSGDTTITSFLDSLDMEMKDIQEDIDASVADKYVESVSGFIAKNTEHILPYSIIYTANATVGREGNNMDVYMDGQLLAADTGAAGVNADRDYGETTTSGITFRFNVQIGRNITYMLRQ